MDEFWLHVGISPMGALGVVVASIALYLMYSVVLAVWGPRLFTSSSTLSLALLTVLGALFARAMLGHWPTLAGALIAASTLLLLEALLGRLRRFSPFPRSARHRPRVVMIEGVFVPRPIRKRVTTEANVLARMRTSGVRHVADVALVILESRGRLTVLRKGERIDAVLLEGVLGHELVPAHLIGER